MILLKLFRQKTDELTGDTIMDPKTPNSFFLALRKRRYAVSTAAGVLVIFALFQNCGAQSTSDRGTFSSDSGSGGIGNPLSAMLVPNSNLLNFTSSGTQNVIISNLGSASANQVLVTASFSTSGLSVTNSSCFGSIAGGSNCQISVKFVQTTSALSGTLTVNYRDQNNTPMTPVSIAVTGSKSGSSSSGGTSGWVQYNGNNTAIQNAPLTNAPVSTPTPSFKSRCEAVYVDGYRSYVTTTNIFGRYEETCVMKVPSSQKDQDQPSCPSGWSPHGSSGGVQISITEARSEQEHTNASGGRAWRSSAFHSYLMRTPREPMTLCTWRNWLGCKQYTTYKAYMKFHACH